MKYLVLLIVVVVFVWHWRSNRRAEIAERQRKVHPSPNPSMGPEDMVQCAYCQIHIAQSDAVTGRRDRYCCAEHRALAEA